MKLKFAKIFIASVLTLLSLGSYGFGLGSCCSGGPCGIVPCDASCAGPAITEMGISVGAEMTKLQTAYTNEGSRLQDAIASFNTLSTNVVETSFISNSEVLKGLDASTNRIEMALTQSTKTKERLTDHTLTTAINSISQTYMNDKLESNKDQLSDESQPISGTIQTNATASLVKINTQINQLHERYLINAQTYISGGNHNGEPGRDALHTVKALAAIEKINDPTAIVTSTVLESDQLNTLHEFINILLEPQPLQSKPEPGQEAYELERIRYLAKLMFIYDAFSSVLHDKAGLDDGAWEAYHADLAKSSANEISRASYYDAVITGALTDPEWWGSIKRLNIPGAQREILYQDATAMTIETQLNQLSEISDRLTALSLSSHIEHAYASSSK